eukprot:4184259-Pleurochrysis_carterae.AAC.3
MRPADQAQLHGDARSRRTDQACELGDEYFSPSPSAFAIGPLGHQSAEAEPSAKLLDRSQEGEGGAEGELSL